VSAALDPLGSAGVGAVPAAGVGAVPVAAIGAVPAATVGAVPAVDATAAGALPALGAGVPALGATVPAEVAAPVAVGATVPTAAGPLVPTAAGPLVPVTGAAPTATEAAAPLSKTEPAGALAAPKPASETKAPEPVPKVAEDPETERMMKAYDDLGKKPPKVDIVKNDGDYADAHTLERHGPDIPLERNGAPAGDRTIGGRIYGDPPWRPSASTSRRPLPPDNFSYKWKDVATINRTVNKYLQDNWEQVRSDLAQGQRHEATFNTKSVVGEGYYNNGQHGVGPRQATYGKTNTVTITINTVPTDPSAINIIRAFPNGKGY